MSVKIKDFTTDATDSVVYTAPTSGLYTVTSTLVSVPVGTSVTYSYNKSNGYPDGVQDFRGLTAIQCVDQLEQALKKNPELAKAIELMNSKLYKALK